MLLLVVARVVSTVACLATVVSWLGSFYLLELTTHFRVQYLVIALGCAGLLAWRRAWRWMGVSLLCAAVNAPGVVSWYVPPAGVDAGSARHDLRLLLSNVNYANARRAALIELVRAEHPHIVVLQEITPTWLAELEILREAYPYWQAAPRVGGRGMAVLGAIPFEEARVVYLGGSPSPNIAVKVRAGGRRVSIVSTHPTSPVLRGWFHARNAQLDGLYRYVREIPDPRIVVGDLNTTPWSPYYTRFARDTGLVNVRKGFGVLPTWPAALTVGALMIPIDHCLVSAEFAVLDVRTGPNIGSDHLPLIVDLAVNEAPSVAARLQP